MQKKFITNLALLISLNLLVKPFWIFGIDRGVQNAVGAESYGFYFSIFNFAFLFSILLDAGITNFNNRNIAQHSHLLNKHFSGIIILKFLLALVYSIIIFLVAWVIGYDGDQMKLLVWIAANQFLLSFIQYLRSNISGLLLFRTDSIISVLDRILMIIICGVLLWGNVTHTSFRIEWFVYAQTVSYVLTLLVALVVVARRARFRKLTWNLPFFLVIIKRSFPFALLVLLMSVYNRVDTVFIERLLKGGLGYEQSGIYAQAFRLLDAANQFALLFAVLLLPIYSKMIKQRENVAEMVRLPFSILYTFGVILAVGSLYYRTEIMELLYPRAEGETLAGFAARSATSAKVYGIIMFGFLGTCMMYVFSTLLTANGNLRQLNLVSLAGIVVNFTLNLILIPRLLAVGSAFASLATQLFTAAAYVILAQVYFRFRLSRKMIGSVVFYTAGVFLIGSLTRNIPVDWITGLAVFIAAGLLLAVLLRLLSVRSMVAVIRSKS